MEAVIGTTMIPRGSLLCHPAGGPVTASAGAAATTGAGLGVSGCDRVFDDPDRRWWTGVFKASSWALSRRE